MAGHAERNWGLGRRQELDPSFHSATSEPQTRLSVVSACVGRPGCAAAAAARGGGGGGRCRSRAVHQQQVLAVEEVLVEVHGHRHVSVWSEIVWSSLRTDRTRPLRPDRTGPGGFAGEARSGRSYRSDSTLYKYSYT